MASTARGMAVRLTMVAAIATLGLVGLAGCKDTAHPTASATPSASSPSSSASASATPDATPSDAPSRAAGTPIGVDCDGLISRQQMYDFNPNFSLLGSWSPDAGTPAADAVAARGTVCRWQNGTSGDVIDISVASFDEGTLEAKATATSSSSTKVDSYGSDEAYFSANGGVGEAVVFHGTYWVVVRSVAFFEAGDARSIVSSVLAAL